MAIYQRLAANLSPILDVWRLKADDWTPNQR